MPFASNDIGGMIAALGQSVQVRLAGRFGKTVTGIFDNNYTALDIPGGIQVESRTPMIMFDPADVVGIDENDEVVVDGQIYIVLGSPRFEDGFINCDLQKDQG